MSRAIENLQAAIQKPWGFDPGLEAFLIWPRSCDAVNFEARTVSYYGCNGEEYVESYPTVSID